MSIKSIAKKYDEMKGHDMEYAMSQEGIDDAQSLIKEFTENAIEAKKVILSTVSESEFVKYMNMAENLSLTAMVSCGELDALKLKTSGVLTDYTHTVVMAVIGGLMRDEVI